MQKIFVSGYATTVGPKTSNQITLAVAPYECSFELEHGIVRRPLLVLVAVQTGF